MAKSDWLEPELAQPPLQVRERQDGRQVSATSNSAKYGWAVHHGEGRFLVLQTSSGCALWYFLRMLAGLDVLFITPLNTEASRPCLREPGLDAPGQQRHGVGQQGAGELAREGDDPPANGQGQKEKCYPCNSQSSAGRAAQRRRQICTCPVPWCPPGPEQEEGTAIRQGEAFPSGQSAGWAGAAPTWSGAGR